MAIFSRQRSEPPEDRAAMRARVVQLTAENERLQDESRRDLEVRVELAQAVRTLSVELCEQRVELRAVRQAHDWNNALDDLTN